MLPEPYQITDGLLLGASHGGEWREESTLVTLVRALIPSWGFHLHDTISSYLTPKAPLPDTIA